MNSSQVPSVAPIARVVWLLLAASFVAWLPAPEAWAHDARPLYVELTANAPQHYQLAWKVPDSLSPTNQPAFQVGPECTPLAANTTAHRQWLQCGKPPTQLAWRFAQQTPALTTVLRFRTSTGVDHNLVVAPGQTQITLPTTAKPAQVFSQYIRLGAVHIWRGADHLLFLVCLLLLAGKVARLVWAITGFTLGHCTTLALATLGIINIPVAPAEVCIALSIAWLAAELVRANHNKTHSLSSRAPGFVAAAFGLLHGLGFASVLTEIGLPQGQLLSALLGFNLGVELGQLAFVAVLILLTGIARRTAVLQRLGSRFGTYAKQLSLYSIGTLAMFWTVQRLSLF